MFSEPLSVWGESIDNGSAYTLPGHNCACVCATAPTFVCKEEEVLWEDDKKRVRAV